MITDPIADLLTRIRNAVHARREKTIVRYSRLNQSLLEVLKAHGFIQGHNIVKEGSFDVLEVWLDLQRRTIHMKRVSKPGQRIYIKKNEIMPVRNRYGIALISTPKGIMTGEKARKEGMGGEYICQVW